MAFAQEDIEALVDAGYDDQQIKSYMKRKTTPTPSALPEQDTQAQTLQASAPPTATPYPLESRMSSTAGGDVLGRETEFQKGLENKAWNVLSGITPVGSAHGLMTEGMH